LSDRPTGCGWPDSGDGNGRQESNSFGAYERGESVEVRGKEQVEKAKGTVTA
jgi:hypothetical protein